MKIIDFEVKGNQIKFYLGNDNCTNYWGDDWNDRPYEHNAGTVYDEFVRGIKYLTFDFDDVVVEPCNGELNSPYSKEDMINRKVPCVCVLKKEYIPDDMWDFSFKQIVGNENVISYYFGDEIEPDEIIKKNVEKKYLHIHIDTPTKQEAKLIETTTETVGKTINAIVSTGRELEDNADKIFKSNTLTNLKKYFNNILKQIQKIYLTNVDVDILNRITLEIINEKTFVKSKREGTYIEDLYIEIYGNDIYDIGNVTCGRNYKMWRK